MFFYTTGQDCILKQLEESVIFDDGAVDFGQIEDRQLSSLLRCSGAKIPRWGILGEEKTDSSTCLSI